MAANWGQQNLGRFQNASDALFKGQDARNKAWQNYHDRVKQMLDLGVTAWQNAEQRQLMRDLPEVQAKAAANEQQYKNRVEAEGLGLAQNPSPETPVQDIIPKTAQLPKQPKVTEEAAPKAANTSKETADGTMYPAQYANKYGGDWKDLRFYDPAGNDVTQTIIDQANRNYKSGGGKVPAGVTVDYSRIVPPQEAGPPQFSEYAQKMKEQGMMPTSYSEEPTPLKDVMSKVSIPGSEAAATPVGAQLPEGVKMPSETKPDIFTGEGFEKGYLGRSKKFQNELEIEKGQRTERYASIVAQLKSDHPGWGQDKIDQEAKTLYLGWYYGQGPGSSDKDKRDPAQLLTYAMKIKEKAVAEDTQGLFDRTTGNPLPGKEEDAYKYLANYATRYYPSAFNKNAFDRNDLNLIFDPIVANDEKTWAQAENYFEQLYKNPAAAFSAAAGGESWKRGGFLEGIRAHTPEELRTMDLYDSSIDKISYLAKNVDKLQASDKVHAEKNLDVLRYMKGANNFFNIGSGQGRTRESLINDGWPDGVINQMTQIKGANGQVRYKDDARAQILRAQYYADKLKGMGVE